MQDIKFCNCCGKEFDIFDEQQDFTIHKRIQYGSSYDGCVINLQLCCDCFDKIVKRCVIAPIVEESEFMAGATEEDNYDWDKDLILTKTKEHING